MVLQQQRDFERKLTWNDWKFEWSNKVCLGHCKSQKSWLHLTFTDFEEDGQIQIGLIMTWIPQKEKKNIGANVYFRPKISSWQKYTIHILFCLLKKSLGSCWFSSVFIKSCSVQGFVSAELRDSSSFSLIQGCQN